MIRRKLFCVILCTPFFLLTNCRKLIVPVDAAVDYISRYKEATASRVCTSTTLPAQGPNITNNMVSAKVVRASNALIPSTLPSSPAALFVGGTNGIGRATLKAFAAYTRFPTIFVVGRSQKAAEELLCELRTKINPEGTYEVLIADCALLSEVDRVCEIVKGKLEAQGKELDYLSLSCGFLSFGGRDGKSHCALFA